MAVPTLTDTISTEKENVCFDGQNLRYLGALREFFLSYNLAVIENNEAIQDCLYWIVCGNAAEIQQILESTTKKSKGLILLILNEDLTTAQKLVAQFNAKGARITDRNITSADARVVFGLLFSNTETVITLYEQGGSDLTVSGLSFTNAKTQDDTQALSSWDEHKKTIDLLIINIYQAQNAPKKKVGLRVFLNVIQSLALGLVVLLVAHLLLLFSGLWCLWSTQRSFACLPFIRPLLSATITTGNVLTAPILLFTNKAPQGLLHILERVNTVVVALEDAKNQPVALSAVVSGNNSLLQTVQIAQGVFEIITPELLLIEAELKNVQSKTQLLKYTPFLNTLTNQALFSVKEIIGVGASLRSFASMAPLLLDTGEAKTYLLLFQNSRELRPTGGFIGSVGLLTVKHGNIQDLEMFDVYDVDGQLRGHVDPPLPIRTILQQEHWYLRDSNWSPDFSVSAERALWFLEKSLGKQADGVIAVSLPVVEDLLAITGPINIPELNRVVSSENVFEFIYSTTRQGFFPGSTAKKDALVRLFEVINKHLVDVDALGLFRIGSLLVSHVQQKNIQVFSSDSKTQQELMLRNLAGVFPPKTPCPSEATAACVQDVFAVVEANLGVNKANGAVNREYKRVVYFDKQELLREDSVLLRNNNTAVDLSGGGYRTYTRMYFPVGTTIESVQVDNQLLPVLTATDSARPLPYTEIIDEKQGLVTLGVALEVPKSEQVLIKVLSSQFFTQSVKAYSLGVFKHGGTADSLFSLTVNPPQGHMADSLVNSEVVLYNTKLRRDDNIIVSFTPEVQ